MPVEKAESAPADFDLDLPGFELLRVEPVEPEHNRPPGKHARHKGCWKNPGCLRQRPDLWLLRYSRQRKGWSVSVKLLFFSWDTSSVLFKLGKIYI